MKSIYVIYKLILHAFGRVFKAKIWRDTHGVVVIFMCIGIIPIITLGVYAVRYADMNTAMTRLQQAQMEALYAVTKEGPEYAPREGEGQGRAWINLNMAFLGRDKDSLKHDFSIGSRIVDVQSSYTSSFLDDSVISAKAKQNMSAWYYYTPVEIALALDASYSYGDKRDLVIRAIRGAAHEAFLGRESADDAWVSFAFSSEMVNVGTKYGQELINPASRAPYYDSENWQGSAAVQNQIREFKAQVNDMLARHYPQLVGNLFQPGAPGYNQGMACFHRQPLTKFDERQPPVSKERVIQYVEDYVFKMPVRGFDLVLGLPVPMEGWQTGAKKNGESLFGSDSWSFLNISLGRDDTVYSGYSFDETVLAHEDYMADEDMNYNWRDKSDVLATARRESRYWWWGDILSMSYNFWDPYDIFITPPGGCPGTPMHVGAQDMTTLISVLDDWGITQGSAHDESFAWALRALSPDYSDVWGVSDYPANFRTEGGNREKRLIFISDSDVSNQGYSQRWWGEADLISAMCEEGKKRGIDFYMVRTVIPGRAWSAEAQKIFDNCAPSDRQIEIGVDSLEDGLREACRRKFRVRLGFL